MRALLVAAAAALSLTFPSTAPVAAQAMVSVDIIDTPRPIERWGYAPRVQRVPAGSWVTWSNAGQDAHSVTATDFSFDSLELQPSEGFSWFFDLPGTYEYYCTLHDWMVARVVVDGEAVGEAEPAVLELEAEPAMEAPAEDPQ